VDYDPEAERASFAAMHEWLRASFAR
jgi:hypothetical protein